MKRILILIALVFCFTSISEAACISAPVVLAYGTPLTGITFNPGDSVTLFTLPISEYSFAHVNCTNSVDPGFLSNFKIYYPNVCSGGFCPLYFGQISSFVPITGPGDIILKNIGTSSYTFTSDINAVCTVEVF